MPGGKLARSAVLEAVEELGSYFRGYSVQLLLQLAPSPYEPHENTRNVLRAWALRNPNVQLHALRVASATASPGTPQHRARLASLAALRLAGAAAVRALPPSVAHVLMLDLESADTFSPAALLSALEWDARWDAVCAPSMGADGSLSDVQSLRSDPIRSDGFLSGGHSLVEEPPRADEEPPRAAPPLQRQGELAPAAPAAPTTILIRSAPLRVHTCASGLALYHRPMLELCRPHEAFRAMQQGPWTAAAAAAVSGTSAAAAEEVARQAARRAVAAAAASADQAAAAALAKPPDDAPDDTPEDAAHSGAGGADGHTAAAVVSSPAAACERTSLHRCLARHGHDRLFVLPTLVVRRPAAREDVQYLLITLLMLLPALAPCVAFCRRTLNEYLPKSARGAWARRLLYDPLASCRFWAGSTLHNVRRLLYDPLAAPLAAAVRASSLKLRTAVKLPTTASVAAARFSRHLQWQLTRLRVFWAALGSWTAARPTLARRRLLGLLGFVVLLQVGLLCRHPSLHSSLPDPFSLTAPLPSPSHSQVALLCRQLHRVLAQTAAAAYSPWLEPQQAYTPPVPTPPQDHESRWDYHSRPPRQWHQAAGHVAGTYATWLSPTPHDGRHDAGASAAHAPADGSSAGSSLPSSLPSEATSLFHVGLLVPLLLPVLTAVDLLSSPRSGPLAFRLPAAALALLTPLFVLLELRRLQAVEVPAHDELSAEGASEGGLGLLGAGGLAGLLRVGTRAAASWLRQPWPSSVGLSLGLCEPSTPDSCAAVQ